MSNETDSQMNNPEEDDHVLLARMDERLRAMQKEIHDLRQNLIDYITRHEFFPVKVIALGLAGLILSAVIASILAQVIK